MSKIKILCLNFFSILTLNVSSQSDHIIRPKTYTAFKTNELINIDGLDKELVWKSVKWSSNFVDIEGTKTPIYQTNFKHEVLVF